MRVKFFKKRPSRFVKKLLPRTLYGRSFLIVIMPLFFAQLVSTYVFFERHWDTITRQLANSLAGDVAAVLELYQKSSSFSFQQLVLYASDHFNLTLAPLPHENLESYATGGSPAKMSFLESGFFKGFFSQTLQESFLVDAFNQRFAYPFEVRIKEPDIHLKVQVGESNLYFITSTKRVFSRTTYIFIMWSIGTALLSLSIALLFMRNQMRPLGRLARAAEAFGKGQDVAGFKPEGAVEVRKASTAFIIMRERIKRQISQRTEMLAGVSHDLRTPLTRMKLQLALLKGTAPALEGLQKDIKDMEKMVEDFLSFARGEGREKPIKADLITLICQVVESFQSPLCEITCSLPPTLMMTLRPTSLKRCLTNLLANGIRLATKIHVAVRSRSPGVEILIDDNGPGIPKDRRDEVFRPFVRLDEARNADEGGSGLGLTIARDIARSHGGDIVLDMSPQKGLRVLLQIPW